MSISNVTNINLIKHQAKKIKTELNIKHQQAVDVSAKRAGFQSYHHARKELINTPHKVMYGVDIKHYMDADSRGILKQYGFTERYDYSEACYELALETLNQEQLEDWQSINDWVAIEAAPMNVKDINDAIAFGLKAFFFEPVFMLFDGMVIELEEREYPGKTILGEGDIDDLDNLPSCLVEDYQL